MKTTFIPADTPCPALPVVLLHGWGHGSAIWQPLMKALNGQYPLLLADYSQLDASTSWQAAVHALMAQLPPACMVVGWSLGGQLAVQLALSSKKVKAVLTLACNPSFIAKPHWPHAMAPQQFDAFVQQFSQQPEATLQGFIGLQLLGEPKPKALRQQLLPLLPPTQPAGFLNTLEWLRQCDHSRSLPQLKQPQLHLLGEKDALVPAAVKALMPHTRLLADAGHLLPISQVPALVQALEQLQAQAAAPNKYQVAQSFSQAAGRYNSLAALQVTVGERLVQHLPPLPAGAKLLDIGCGTGLLSRCLPEHRLIALDIAPAMLQLAKAELGSAALWLQGDAEQLPIADAQLDGATANLALQWCYLPQVLAEVQRCLKPGGWCVFSTLGPGSLLELKTAWQTLDQRVHVNPFASQAQLATQLAASGLVVQQFQAQAIPQYFPQLRALLYSLKGLGARNLNPGQGQGLLTPRQFQRLSRAYEAYRQPNGQLVLTYEVFWVVAQKPAP